MRRLPPLQEHPDYMERVLRSFWVRSWSEDRDVHTVEDITAVGRAAGMQESQIQRCLQLMATPAVKSKLKVPNYWNIKIGLDSSRPLLCS